MNSLAVSERRVKRLLSLLIITISFAVQTHYLI